MLNVYIVFKIMYLGLITAYPLNNFKDFDPLDFGGIDNYFAMLGGKDGKS